MYIVTGFYSFDSTPTAVECVDMIEVENEVEYLKEQGYIVGILKRNEAEVEI